MITRYKPIETFYKKAVAADATAGKVVFTLPYLPTGVIAQIRADATGAVNSTGLSVKIDTNSTTGVITATVGATTITLADHVSLIVF